MNTLENFLRMLVSLAVVLLLFLAVERTAYFNLTRFDYYLVVVAVELPVVVVVLYQSFYLVGADQMIVFYFLGSYSRTVVSRTFWEVEEAEQPEESKVSRKGGRVSRGLLDQDIAFGGLWPFVLGWRVPTGQFEVPVHVTDMYTGYTDDIDGIYRMRMRCDPTWQVRVSPNTRRLGLVFPLFRSTSLPVIIRKANRDLTVEECLPSDQEAGVAASHEHRLPRIARVMHATMDKPTIEAARTALAHFSWGGGRSQDIVVNRQKFEIETKAVLVEDPDTVFVQAGLLSPGNVPEEVQEGVSAIVCNLVVESMALQPARPDDSDAIKAIDRPFIGGQEGRFRKEVEAKTRAGQALGIRELADRLGLGDTEAALLLDVLRQREGSVNLGILGGEGKDSLVEAARRLIQRRQ